MTDLILAEFVEWIEESKLNINLFSLFVFIISLLLFILLLFSIESKELLNFFIDETLSKERSSLDSFWSLLLLLIIINIIIW